MRLLKEHINEKFVEDSDPIEDMGIGVRKKIKEWIETIPRERNARLTNEGKIDAAYVDISIDSYKYLPDYIKFGVITGDFICNLYPKESLKHMPDEVFGDIIIYCSKKPREYTNKKLRSICKLHGKLIWRRA